MAVYQAVVELLYITIQRVHYWLLRVAQVVQVKTLQIRQVLEQTQIRIQIVVEKL
jgi:hypothetical protein